MIFQQSGTLAIIIFMITTLAIMISANWRHSLIALAIQYGAVFWLVAIVWPVGLSLVKLVIGLMVAAVIGASQPTEAFKDARLSRRSGLLFRLLASGLIWLAVFSIAPKLQEVIPIQSQLLLGSLMLVGMGLLQMGVTTMPLRVLLGLLTILSGFEILYAAVEPSILVAGLLAVVNLGLALAGAYWLLPIPSPGGEE